MKDGTLPSQRYHTFVLLMLSGGFMGAYSYFLKGGVFANAETANLLILAFNIAELNTEGIISVLYPISAFFIGTFFSQMFIEKLGRRWIPTLLIVEIMALISLSLLPSETPDALISLSLLPSETPDRVFHVVIAVLSSMQFNTFRKARGVAMSTLFCTAHLRGFGASLYSAIADRKGEELKKSLYHGGLIMTFLAGGISCSLISKSLGGYTIALSSLPLLFVLQEVLRKER